MTGKALAALATVVAFSAAPVALAATDLVVWHAYRGDEKAAFEKVVGMYNAKQKDVVVKTLAVPYDAYADKITASVPRGKGPDVFIFAQDRLGGWVEAGQTIEPIDFFVDEKVTSQFVPGNDAGDDLPRHGLRPAAQLQEHRHDLQHGAGEDAAEDHGRARQGGEGPDQRAVRAASGSPTSTRTSSSTRR